MGIVYRIQSKHDRNRGAYHSHSICEDELDAVKHLLSAHCNFDDTEHPTPERDVGCSPKPDEHCGFDSAGKLLRWFRGFIPNLLRAGYEIVALHDVTVTAAGEKQVLFRWDN